MENLILQLHKNLARLGNKKIAFVLEGRDASGKGGFVKLLINYDIPFIKIPSAHITNKELIKECSMSNIPLIISTGMSNWDIID